MYHHHHIKYRFMFLLSVFYNLDNFVQRNFFFLHFFRIVLAILKNPPNSWIQISIFPPKTYEWLTNKQLPPALLVTLDERV